MRVIPFEPVFAMPARCMANTRLQIPPVIDAGADHTFFMVREGGGFALP